MSEKREAPPPDEPEINWREVARAALSSAVVAGIIGSALKALGSMLEANARAAARDAAGIEFETFADDPPVQTEGDEEAQRAAALLGIELDAGEDEIRAALRAQLATSRLHPDQGGDGEAAKELIAAKNLLIERARSAQR